MSVDDLRPDLRSATDWLDGHQGPRRRRRRLPRVLAAGVALAVTAGALYAGGRVLGFDPTGSSRDAVHHLLNDVPSLPPLPPEETPPPRDPNAAPDPGTQDDLDRDAFRARYDGLVASRADLVEGRDYSFITKVDDLPVRWSCERTIPVVLSGDVPSGTEASLREVASLIAAESALPLRVERETGHRPPTSGQLVVYYAAEGVAPGRFSVEGNTVGRAAPNSWLTGPNAGFVGQGEVVIRNDLPKYLPDTAAGKEVLAHELMHALGLGHAAVDMVEVMEPYAGDPLPLGEGDRLALRIVGCGA